MEGGDSSPRPKKGSPLKGPLVSSSLQTPAPGGGLSSAAQQNLPQDHYSRGGGLQKKVILLDSATRDPRTDLFLNDASSVLSVEETLSEDAGSDTTQSSLTSRHHGGLIRRRYLFPCVDRRLDVSWEGVSDACRWETSRGRRRVVDCPQKIRVGLSPGGWSGWSYLPGGSRWT